MVETFINSLVIGYSGAVMPGSLLTYTLNRSLKYGARAGFIISIGHSLLELAVVVLIMLGFGKYLQSDTAQKIIGIVGGLVLCFFGISMLRDIILNKVNVDFSTARNTGGNESAGSTGKRKINSSMLLSGIIISASNPYFCFWWAVIGLNLIMTAYNRLGFPGVIAVYISHITCDISWYSFVSALISKTRRFINLKAYKGIILFLGIVLIGFGLSFMINSINTIMS